MSAQASLQSLQQIVNPFHFTDQEVRTALDDIGNAWFCAKDVFEALGITWKGASGSLKNYPKNWQGVLYLQTPGGVQEAVFLSEAGVYQTAFGSRKPNAVQFTNWVCAEVLPAIRRQGYYGKPNLRERAALSRQFAQRLERMVASRDAFELQLLTSEVRDLCNLIGHAMPDIALLGQDPKQLALGLPA